MVPQEGILFFNDSLVTHDLLVFLFAPVFGELLIGGCIILMLLVVGRVLYELGLVCAQSSLIEV